MKKLQKISDSLFTQKESIDMSKVIGGFAPYNTYATSGAGGGTVPAGTPSDTNDTATNQDGSDWVNN